MGKPWSNTLELKANFLDDDDDPDDDDVPFGYGGSAAVSHIQDECMAHEEDMLAFEYDSGWGGQDEDDDDFAEDGGFF